MALEQEYKKALKEIGPIEPWWSDEDGMFVFEHDLYPFVMHADPDKQKTIDGYCRALKGFIEERLAGNVAETVERITSGRGGYRPGAGRKPGSTKEPTKMVRLPIGIADWLKDDPAHIEQVRRLMQG